LVVESYQELLPPWDDAVEYCLKILKKFRPKHKRIKIFIGFEVEPAVWSDCPHAENPEQALRKNFENLCYQFLS